MCFHLITYRGDELDANRCIHFNFRSGFREPPSIGVNFEDHNVVAQFIGSHQVAACGVYLEIARHGASGRRLLDWT
jgi:hypothetical protein